MGRGVDYQWGGWGGDDGEVRDDGKGMMGRGVDDQWGGWGGDDGEVRDDGGG